MTGRSYTYSEAQKLSRRFGVSLQKAGYKKNDVIAVVLPNTPEFPLIFFGAIEAGMVVTTVNPVFTPGMYYYSYIFVDLLGNGNCKLLFQTQG